MDYSYFTSAPQPYQFFGDDQQNTHSQQQLSHINDYPSQLTAVRIQEPISRAGGLISAQEQYDAAFAAFQQSFQYDPNAFLQQPAANTTSAPLSASPTHTTHPRSFSISLPEVDHKSIPPLPNDVSPDIGDDINPGQNRSSSEEKDNLTPQQSRRKAQNRAA
jgi:hypothetical protein